jgi:hypothetical protein
VQTCAQLGDIFPYCVDCETLGHSGSINYLTVKLRNETEMECFYDETSNEFTLNLCDGLETFSFR